MIRQNAQPPYTMTCLRCGQSWDPEPVKTGPTKGEHTDHSFNKSIHDHRCPTEEAA